MKTTPLFIVLLLMNLSFIYSQEYTFGIKGGLNSNSIGELYHIGTPSGGGTGVIPYEDTYYKADKHMGYQFGAFAMIEYNGFFLRPELNFVSLKNSYPLAKRVSNWKSSRIDIPILLGVQVYYPFSLYAGPVFSKISSMKLEGAESPIVFKKSSMNLNVGILVDFGRFGIDVRYEHGLKTVEQQRVDILRAAFGTNVARLLEYKPSLISVSLHINLLKINGYDRRPRVKKGWRGKCLN